MKKIILISIIAAFIGTDSVIKVISVHSGSNLFLENIEALASGADLGASDPCCKNGYKKWKATSNVPTQRKESFKDCWCNSKEGYDPENCEC